MKRKYWIPVTSLLLLLDVLLIAGCNRPTTQTISTPLTTATTLNVPTITASDAHNLIQKNIGNPGFVILDARTADEFNSGYIAGAINMDYYSPQFKTDVNKLDKNKQYLIYCASGVRGAAATQIMMGLGFKDAQNMAGGITAWIQDGYPITTPTTITTTSASVITTMTNTSASSVNGLQLRLSVSTASLTSEDMLEINVIEYNTLSKTNNVAANNTCGIDGLALGACKNIYIQPFGVALFQGHFTAQNISQATALRIYPLVPCPLFIRKVTGYIFLPDSINAAVLPGGNVSSLTPMSAEVTVTGILNQGTQSHPLDSGVYTVVAGDEWRALEFLYINVE